MDQPLCKLTIVYPTGISDGLIDMLLGMEPPVRGFTTFAAEGHGFDFTKATIKERVRGRVERGVLMAVMPRSDASRILEMIRRKLPVPHLAYWIEPVLECGRLIDETPGDALGAVEVPLSVSPP